MQIIPYCYVFTDRTLLISMACIVLCIGIYGLLAGVKQ